MKKVMIDGEEWSSSENFTKFMNECTNPDLYQNLYCWREKKKPMPEIRMGDAVIIDSHPMTLVVISAGEHGSLGSDFYGIQKSFRHENLITLYRDGVKIWERS